MIEASERHDLPAEQLRAIVETDTSFHAHHVMPARVANQELPALPPDQREPILAIRLKTEQLIQSVLRRGVASGDFEMSDIRVATFAILSLCISVSRWYRPEGRLTPEELGKLHDQLALNMVKGLSDVLSAEVVPGGNSEST